MFYDSWIFISIGTNFALILGHPVSQKLGPIQQNECHIRDQRCKISQNRLLSYRYHFGCWTVLLLDTKHKTCSALVYKWENNSRKTQKAITEIYTLAVHGVIDNILQNFENRRVCILVNWGQRSQNDLGWPLTLKIVSGKKSFFRWIERLKCCKNMFEWTL